MNHTNLDIKRIDDLIRSVISEKYTDSIQDVWVKILDNGISDDNEIIKVAREINHKHANQAITEQHKLLHMEKPLISYDDKTIGDLIGFHDDNITGFLNDYEVLTHIFRDTGFIKESHGICTHCKQDGDLLNYLCVRCWDLFVESKDTDIELYDKIYKQINYRIHLKEKQDLYRYRKVNNLCRRCGKPPVINMKYCQDCLEYNRQYLKNTRAKKKQDGICVECSEPVTGDSIYCTYHLRNKKERSKRSFRELYSFRKNNGLCVQCGLLNHNGKARCDKCLIKQSEYFKEYRRKSPMTKHN